MIKCSEIKKDQTCRNTDLEQPSQMAEIKHDFDVAEKLGPEMAETVAKLAKGQMWVTDSKEKTDRYARPKALNVVIP